MRVNLGSMAALALVIASCGACSGPGSGQAAAASANSDQSVQASGCPVAGPTAGCLTIASGGQTYDLAGANPAIDLSKNVNINVSGVASGAKSACGVKLSDITVDYLSFSCGPPKG
jgi:hypothetical protein